MRFLIGAFIALTCFHAKAQVTILGGYFESNNGFVEGSNTRNIGVLLNLANGVSSSGDTLTMTFDQAVLDIGGTPVLSFEDATGVLSPQPAGTATESQGDGTELVYTLGAGNSVTLSGTLIVIITSGYVATLPSQSQLSVNVVTTGNSASGSTAILDTIQSPAFQLCCPSTPNTMDATLTPTHLEIDFALPQDLAASDKITITADQAIFVAGQTSGVTQYTGLSSAPGVSSTSTTVLELTLNAVAASGTAIDLKLANPLLAALPSVAGPVYITATVTVGTVVLEVFKSRLALTITIPPSPGVSGDPITEYGGKKVEFVLPFGTWTTLMQSPVMRVLASPYPGEVDGEQWIGRIRITNSAGTSLMEVGIKNDLAMFNRSKIPAGAFETLDVKVGSQMERLVLMPLGHYALGKQIDLMFGTHRWFGEKRISDAPRREMVLLADPWVHVAISSASAKEWYTDYETGWNHPGLAMKHAHLDLLFPELPGASELTGLLPELWGLQPLTDASRSMIKEDKSALLIELTNESSDLTNDSSLPTCAVDACADASLGKHYA